MGVREVIVRCKEDIYPLAEIYRERSCAAFDDHCRERGLPIPKRGPWSGVPEDERRSWVFGLLRAINGLSAWGVIYPGEPEPTGEPDHGAGAADAATVRAGTYTRRAGARRGRRANRAG